MPEKTDTRNRARLSILSELMSFPTINQKDWISNNLGRDDIQIGDLVSLCSAPDSKWYVSWLRELDENNGWPRYLLESIDDGELCWWENVSLNVYSRKRVSERPTWKWDDKQFAFYGRWRKVCGRNGAYSVLPCLPEFGDDGSVELDIRIRWDHEGYHNPRKFPSWKKLHMEVMDAYYKKCVKCYNSYLNSIAKRRGK